MIEESPTVPLAGAEIWLQRNARLVLVFLMVLASVVRGVTFAELVDSPLSGMHRYDNLDMQFFDQWAGRIAAGDVLSRETRHPIHGWHVEVAEKHFERHSERLEKSWSHLDAAEKTKAIDDLWDEWYGGSRFHQEPLYAYALAASHGMFGTSNPVPFFVLQMLASLATLALLFLATKRIFGAVAAVLATLFGSIWGPWILYDMTLLRVSFITFGGVVLACAAARLHRTSGGSRWLPLFAFGLLIGIATAMKSTFLIFGCGLCVAILWKHGRGIGLVRRATVIVAGIAVVLVAIWIRNAMVGAPLFSMTSVGPVTLAGSNVPGVHPNAGWLIAPISGAVAQVMHAGSESLTGSMSAMLQLHDSFFGWLGLLGEKFAVVWHWYEVPNNTNLYFARMHSSVLQASQLVSVVWMLPAAVVGFVIAIVQRRRVGMWSWYFLCALAPMVLFYVLSRFRVPMVVGLLPFAGFGIAQLLDWVIQRKFEKSLVGLLAFAVLVLAMNRSLLPERPLMHSNAYSTAIHDYYVPKADAARDAGDYAGVLDVFEDLLATRPAYIDEINARRPIRTTDELGMVRDVFLPTYANCAEAALDGQFRERAQFYERHRARLHAAVQAGIK